MVQKVMGPNPPRPDPTRIEERGETTTRPFKEKQIAVRLGEPVPDGLADPLPIESDWRKGFILTLTWKLK